MTIEEGWFETHLMRYDGIALEEVPLFANLGSVGISNMKAAPNGVLWIEGWINGSSGTPPLLARFDGEAWATYDLPAWNIAVGSDGVVWFATENGLQSLDGTDWTYHLQGQEVWGVDVAPDGTVWYSEQDGLHTLGTP